MRRAALLAAIVLLGLAAAPAGQAQSFSLPSADVRAQLGPDGSLFVREDIAVQFSGGFTYGYRDIPLRSGE